MNIKIELKRIALNEEANKKKKTLALKTTDGHNQSKERSTFMSTYFQY